MIELPLVAVSRLVHSLRLAWYVGRVQAVYEAEERNVRRGQRSELNKMRTFKASIDALKREAMEMLRAAPWAKDQIVEHLEQRLKAMCTVMAGEVPTTGTGSNKRERTPNGSKVSST